MAADLIDLAAATPLYRTFRLVHLREALATSTMVLVRPSLWDDPFENIVQHFAITDFHEGRPRQTFLGNSQHPIHAQCWSLTRESDAHWRVYSVVRKNVTTGRNLAADEEGVRVRSTAIALLDALEQATVAEVNASCFLGRVQYLPEREVLQRVAYELGRSGESAFATARGHAASMLLKREPFDHEREARLILVTGKADPAAPLLLRIRIDPSALFEEIVLDPRLHPADVQDREAEFRRLGYAGPIRRSDLYQGSFFMVPVGRREVGE